MSETTTTTNQTDDNMSEMFLSLMADIVRGDIATAADNRVGVENLRRELVFLRAAADLRGAVDHVATFDAIISLLFGSFIVPAMNVVAEEAIRD